MDNERIVFSQIPVKLDPEDFKAYLLKKASPRTVKMYEKYIPAAEAVIKPRAIVRWADAEVKDGDTVIIAGVEFKSSQLAERLKGRSKVVVMADTIGTDINDSDQFGNDFVKTTFSDYVLRWSWAHIMQQLAEENGLKDCGAVTPGTLSDWPVVNNIKLSEIIGNVGEIGLTLNEEGYMTPLYSLSGIFYFSM